MLLALPTNAPRVPFFTQLNHPTEMHMTTHDSITNAKGPAQISPLTFIVITDLAISRAIADLSSIIPVSDKATNFIKGRNFIGIYINLGDTVGKLASIV